MGRHTEQSSPQQEKNPTVELLKRVGGKILEVGCFMYVGPSPDTELAASIYADRQVHKLKLELQGTQGYLF